MTPYCIRFQNRCHRLRSVWPHLVWRISLDFSFIFLIIIILYNMNEMRREFTSKSCFWMLNSWRDLLAALKTIESLNRCKWGEYFLLNSLNIVSMSFRSFDDSPSLLVSFVLSPLPLALPPQMANFRCDKFFYFYF